MKKSDLKVGQYVLRNTRRTLDNGILCDSVIWKITHLDIDRFRCTLEKVDGGEPQTLGLACIHVASDSIDELKQLIKDYKELLKYQRESEKYIKTTRSTLVSLVKSITVDFYEPQN